MSAQPSEEAVRAMAKKLEPLGLYSAATYILSLITPLVEALNFIPDEPEGDVKLKLLLSMELSTWEVWRKHYAEPALAQLAKEGILP